MVVVVVVVVVYSVPLLPSKDVASRHIKFFHLESCREKHLRGRTSWAVGGTCPGRWGLDKPWETMVKNFRLFRTLDGLVLGHFGRRWGGTSLLSFQTGLG